MNCIPLGQGYYTKIGKTTISVGQTAIAVGTSTITWSLGRATLNSVAASLLAIGDFIRDAVAPRIGLRNCSGSSDTSTSTNSSVGRGLAVPQSVERRLWVQAKARVIERSQDQRLLALVAWLLRF